MPIKEANRRYTEHIVQQLDSGDIKLPVLPETALDIQDQLKNGELEYSNLINIVSLDNVVSARLIDLANQTSLDQNISDIPTAIHHLKRGTVKVLADRFCCECLFQPTSDVIDDLIRGVKKRSLHVAELCYQLARQFTSFDPEKAFSAGFLSEIGTLPILCIADSKPGFQNDFNSLNKLIETWQGELSQALMLGWGIESQVASSCLCIHSGTSDCKDNPYTNLLKAAFFIHKNTIGTHFKSNELPQEAWNFLELPKVPDVLEAVVF